jgi:hypothetical protein
MSTRPRKRGKALTVIGAVVDHLRQRFMKNVVVQTDGCWRWTGQLRDNGYGKFSVVNRTQSAHRVSYALFKEDIPADLLVRHTCHQKFCVNPDHLILGTHLDNAQDSLLAGLYLRGDDHPCRKNPSVMPRGERHPHSVLTENSVLSIRERYAAGGCTMQTLASEYRCSITAISCITSGRTWLHVGGPITKPGLGGNGKGRKIRRAA